MRKDDVGRRFEVGGGTQPLSDAGPKPGEKLGKSFEEQLSDSFIGMIYKYHYDEFENTIIQVTVNDACFGQTFCGVIQMRKSMWIGFMHQHHDKGVFAYCGQVR